jgi:hypothetical protein
MGQSLNLISFHMMSHGGKQQLLVALRLELH